MKIVHFSDLHLDAPFVWAGPASARKRRQALRDTLERIIALTREVRADALLCAGDLYEHDRFSPDTARFLRSAFAKLAPTPVFVAPGNHDWHGPQSLYQQVSWSPNVTVFRNDRLEPVTLTDGLTLWGAAHRAPANTDGFLESFKIDRGGIHVALFHGSETTFLHSQEQGKIPHAPFQEAQIERAGLHHAFVGHFHVPRDAPRYTYPGNPDPLSFGESGTRGAVVATIDASGTVTREWRNVAVSRVHDIDTDVTGCRSLQDVRERVAEQLRSRSGIARVTLRGELAIEVEIHAGDLENVADGIDAVVVRFADVQIAYNYDAIAQEPTVRGRFVQDVREAANLSETERHRILATGLRALDGRSDLEVT